VIGALAERRNVRIRASILLIPYTRCGQHVSRSWPRDEADTARWQAFVERLDRGEIRATLSAPMFPAWGRTDVMDVSVRETEGSDRV
jgi:hypothetical protein